MNYITIKNFIFAVYHHSKYDAILHKNSIIDKYAKLLIYELFFFKTANMLKHNYEKGREIFYLVNVTLKSNPIQGAGGKKGRAPDAEVPPFLVYITRVMRQ